MKPTSVRTWMSAAAGSALLAVAACGSRTKEVPLRGAFLVEGQLAITESMARTLQSAPPNFTWIDKNGVRQPLTQISFDSTSGKFSFDFKRENLVRRVGYSPPEYIALMGWARPLERLSAQGYDQNETGYIRLEVFSEVSRGNSGELMFYTQKVAGLPMSASFSTNRSLVVNSVPLPSDKVGVVKVNVKDSNGAPVEGAFVSVIPLSVTGGKDYDVRPYDFRLQSTFTPAANLTNAQGTAQAWPIPSGTDKTSKFQISVSHANYCTQVSPPLFHSPSMSAIDVTLASCSESQLTNQEIEWDVAFPSSLYILQEAKGVLPAGTAYTNQEQVELQFINKSTLLRGLTAQIHEGMNTDSPVIMTQEFPTFASKLIVDLPATFNNGTTASGGFSINLIARLSDDDKAAGRKPFSKLLTGNKGVYRVDPVKQSDFQVLGHRSVANLISGQDDVPFTVKYSQCKDGYKIGIVISAEGKKDPVVNYVPCYKNGNTFYLKDVYKGLTKNAGDNVIQFFRTDEFLNKSTDDISINQINRRTIDVDYGSPDASSASLGSHVAVVDKNANPGIPEGILSNVEITPANVGNFAFVFTSKLSVSSCELINPVPVPDLNPPESTNGKTVGQFYIGPVKSKTEMLNASVDCQTGKIILSSSLVSFPSSSNAPATIPLTLFDKAGNFSSGTLSVPPCSASPTPAEKVCWKNP